MRQDILIGHAVQSDLSEVKRLADENRESLGFVMRSALAFGIENQWLLVAMHQGHLLGFAHYRHRQDTHLQRPSERLNPNTCHWFTHYAGSTLSPTAVTPEQGLI